MRLERREYNETDGRNIDETWSKFKEEKGVKRFVPMAGAESTRKPMIPRTIRSVIKHKAEKQTVETVQID